MIKFQKFYVTNGQIKARAFYSAGQINQKQPDGSFKLRECITLYARDYSDALGVIFKDVGGYQNDTDLMTDYFDEGRVRVFPGDKLYAECMARVVQNKADDAAKAEKKAVAA